MFHTLWRAYVAFAFTCMSVSHMLLRFFLPQKNPAFPSLPGRGIKHFPVRSPSISYLTGKLVGLAGSEAVVQIGGFLGENDWRDPRSQFENGFSKLYMYWYIYIRIYIIMYLYCISISDDIGLVKLTMRSRWCFGSLACSLGFSRHVLGRFWGRFPCKVPCSFSTSSGGKGQTEELLIELLCGANSSLLYNSLIYCLLSMFTRSFSFSLETAWPLWPNKWKDTWRMTLNIFTMSSDFVSWPPEFACHLLFVVDSGMVVACTGTISCAFAGVRNENGWQPLVYFKIHDCCLMCFSRPMRSGQTPGYLWLIYLHMYIIHEYIYIYTSMHAYVRTYVCTYIH